MWDLVTPCVSARTDILSGASLFYLQVFLNLRGKFLSVKVGCIK